MGFFSDVWHFLSTLSIGTWAAVISSIAVAAQTVLSFQVAVRPPATVQAGRLLAAVFVAIGAIGLSANAYSAVMTKSEIAVVGEGLAATIKDGVKTSTQTVQAKANEMMGTMDRMWGNFNQLLGKCMPREDVERMLIVMAIRDTFMSANRGYREFWPPEDEINAQLERLGASWKVRIKGDKLETESRYQGLQFLPM